MYKDHFMNEWDFIYSQFSEPEDVGNILPKQLLTLLLNKREMKVLDLACGTGRHSLLLSQLGFNVVAVDNSNEALRRLGTKLYHDKNSVELMFGHISNIPLATESVDVVLCIKSLSHGTRVEVEKGIKEMLRVLKPGGLIFTDLLAEDDKDLEIGIPIEPKTVVGLPHEKMIPHYFANRSDVDELFYAFNIIKVEKKLVPSSNFRIDREKASLYQITAAKNYKL